ncbi:MAG TPA: META domain-containing protein [Steroidobacteraceae bacterium]
MRMPIHPRVAAIAGLALLTACMTGPEASVPPLPGSAWLASGIDTGRGAMASVVQGTEVTLEFDAEGRVSGVAGCNRYSARYVADGDALRIEEPALTRMACLQPGVMEQERAFVAALRSVASARVDGDRLELRREDGSLALSLHRAKAD